MYRKDLDKLSVGKQRVAFWLTDTERKEICRELKNQVLGNIPDPIHNLTLNGYFEIVKEALLGLCDDNGFMYDIWGSDKTTDIKGQSALDVAKEYMDGRSLFHSDYGDPCGILADIDHNDPVQFKWWKLNANYGGHPWENRMFEIQPFPIPKDDYKWQEHMNDKDHSPFYTDDWLLVIPNYHRNTTYGLRCFLHLRKKNIPVIWETNAERDKRELTKRYYPDLSLQPKWFDLTESFFTKLEPFDFSEYHIQK